LFLDTDDISTKEQNIFVLFNNFYSADMMCLKTIHLQTERSV